MFLLNNNRRMSACLTSYIILWKDRKSVYEAISELPEGIQRVLPGTVPNRCRIIWWCQFYIELPVQILPVWCIDYMCIYD